MTKNGTKSTGRLIWFVAAAFGCVTIVGFGWLVHGWSDLFSHIMPIGSSNIVLSTDMEPIDIALKAKVYDNQKGELNQTVEWDIKIPRAYVDDLQGENGSINHMAILKNGNSDTIDRFKALLAVHLQADGETLEPYTMMAAGQKKFDDNTMVISTYNSDADWWITQNDLCVQQDMFGKASDKVGGPPFEFAGTCFPTIKFCTIYTHIDGWLVTINATKQLYAQPEKVCALTKKFVNQYTLRRDNFPIDVPTGYRTNSKQPKAVTP